jgi:Flp pilus assembly protein TadB
MREFGERSMARGTRDAAEPRSDHRAWERTMGHQRVANRLLAVIVLALVARIATGGAASSVVLVAVIFAALLSASLLLTRYGAAAEPPRDVPGS